MASAVAALNDQEFLMSLCGTDLMKYNTVNKEWTLFLKLNEVSFDSMLIDRKLNRLYLGYDHGRIIVKDLSTGLTLQKAGHGNRHVDIQYGFVNANGTIHRIGGLNDQHITWNKSRGCWNPSEIIPPVAGDYLIWVSSLIYVKSKNIILMIGGHAHDEYFNDPDSVGMWRFDITTSAWQHIANVRRNYSQYDHAVLTSDEQYVIVVCDDNHIDILDIGDENNYQITKSIELKFKYAPFPVLTTCREIDVVVLVSGWFRKLFNSEDHPVACPLDILKLIDQFVCKEMLHLLLCNYTDGAVNHEAFHLSDILSWDSAEIPAPIELPGLN